MKRKERLLKMSKPIKLHKKELSAYSEKLSKDYSRCVIAAETDEYRKQDLATVNRQIKYLNRIPNEDFVRLPDTIILDSINVNLLTPWDDWLRIVKDSLPSKAPVPDKPVVRAFQSYDDTWPIVQILPPWQELKLNIQMNFLDIFQTKPPKDSFATSPVFFGRPRPNWDSPHLEAAFFPVDKNSPKLRLRPVGVNGHNVYGLPSFYFPPEEGEIKLRVINWAEDQKGTTGLGEWSEGTMITKLHKWGDARWVWSLDKAFCEDGGTTYDKEAEIIKRDAHEYVTARINDTSEGRWAPTIPVQYGGDKNWVPSGDLADSDSTPVPLDDNYREDFPGEKQQELSLKTEPEYIEVKKNVEKKVEEDIEEDAEKENKLEVRKQTKSEKTPDKMADKMAEIMVDQIRNDQAEQLKKLVLEEDAKLDELYIYCGECLNDKVWGKFKVHRDRWNMVKEILSWKDYALLVEYAQEYAKLGWERWMALKEKAQRLFQLQTSKNYLEKELEIEEN